MSDYLPPDPRNRSRPEPEEDEWIPGLDGHERMMRRREGCGIAAILGVVGVVALMLIMMAALGGLR